MDMSAPSPLDLLELIAAAAGSLSVSSSVPLRHRKESITGSLSERAALPGLLTRMGPVSRQS